MSRQGIEYYFSKESGTGRMDEKNSKNPNNKDSTVGTTTRSRARKAQNKRKRTANLESSATKKGVRKDSPFSYDDSSDGSSSSESEDCEYVPPSDVEESEDVSESVDSSEESGVADNQDLESVEPQHKRRKCSHRKVVPSSPVFEDCDDEEDGDEESEESDEDQDVEDEDGELDSDGEEKLNEFISQLAAKLGKEVYDNAMQLADENDESQQAGMAGPGQQLIIMGQGQNPYVGGPQEGILIEFAKKTDSGQNSKDKNDKNGNSGKPGKRESRWDKKDKGYNLRKQPSNYRDTLSTEDAARLAVVEKQVFELNRHKVPPRYKVLLSSMSLPSKAKVLSNMDRLSFMSPHSSEYSKLTHWIDGVLAVPFDKYKDLPISLSSSSSDIQSYLANVEKTMNDCIYGQEQAKQSILECVGKWITNPNSSNRPLGFVGEKGTGKTTLAKYGIASALGRPFCMISLGGESDAATFKGHDYTYEGSKWGRVADMLIHCQCMNPVIFFDELDKVSETRQGEEIIGMLMHLTDTTQNDKFSDKYFAGIDLDLSKCLFIFSYNHAHRVNPILLDRLKPIQFDTFKKKDKIIIAKNFLVPAACKNIGILRDRFYISDKTIEELINRYASTEGGVRDLEKIIEYVFERLNLVQLPQTLNLQYKNVRPKLLDGKVHITTDMAMKLLTGVKDKSLPMSVQMMYT
jgi:hypothetical protein